MYETIADYCRFVQVLSNLTGSHISGEGRNEGVGNVKSPRRMQNIVTQSGCVLHKYGRNEKAGNSSAQGLALLVCPNVYFFRGGGGGLSGKQNLSFMFCLDFTEQFSRFPFIMTDMVYATTKNTLRLTSLLKF